MFSKAIIDKLQAARRAMFPAYDEIILDGSAVPVFARLFLNPDCQTDIDLFSLKGREVKLSYLGDHIITAAPSTLAHYAQLARATRLTDKDLLRCFAVNHAHDVRDNRIAEHANPAYALAHILSLSRVTRVKTIDGERVANLTLPTVWGSIVFKNVLVPHDLELGRGQWAYQHFGVVVGVADDPSFGATLVSLQKQDDYIGQLGKTLRRKKLIIDFSNTAMFGKDVLGMILTQKTELIKNPGDLANGKITFKH